MARESANAPLPAATPGMSPPWDHELSKGLLARTIMDEPIAIFRDAQGKVGAVEDRCCHRGAALTDGKVVENGLQCGYHGLVFNGQGKCVEIPGQDAIPPMANIKLLSGRREAGIHLDMDGRSPRSPDETKILDWPFHKGGSQPAAASQRMHADQGQLPDDDR